MNQGQVLDVKVPLRVVLGTTEVSVQALSTMAEGSIVELDSLAGEPVELHAAGELVAWGEVVVIDENFGIRVTKLVNK